MEGLDVNIATAYDFYKRFILDYTQDKKAIYQEYGFNVQGSVGFKDWEVFAAILMKDRARLGDGADLQEHEVKSAGAGSGFEYQYHKNHGMDKLQEDKEVNHVFIARSDDYTAIQVWWVDVKKIVSIFDSWEPELKENYKSDSRQRFRKSITYKTVTDNGIKIMETNNGQLIFPTK